MKKSKPRLAHLGVFVILAIAFYFTIYAIVSNSEPVEYAEAAIRASPEIHSMVGEVQDVSLELLKGYRMKTRSNGRGFAYMSLHISASKRDATIAVQLRREQETWAIAGATIDDQPVNLH